MRLNLLNIRRIALAAFGVTVLGGLTQPVSAADYCTSTETYSNTHRQMTTLNISDGTNSLNFAGTAPASGGSIYYDRTSSVFTTSAGSSITLKAISASGEWMHSYLYIDFGNDGTFDVDETLTTPNGDLYAFDRYSTDGSIYYDSDGNTYLKSNKEDHTFLKQLSLTFNIPADVKPGTYRARYKLDWNCVNPCTNPDSGNKIGTNSGGIVDFTIVIDDSEAPTAFTVTLANIDSTKGSVELRNGTQTIASGTTLDKGTVITVIPTPADGYQLSSITVNNVALTATGGVYSFTLNANSVVSATFQEITTDYCTPSYTYTNSETLGRKVTTMTLSDNAGNSLSVPGVAPALNNSVYTDHTSYVFNTTAGATVTFTVAGAGSWIHSYLYLDFGRDGVFDVPSNLHPGSIGGDVLGYNYWTGANWDESAYNSQGVAQTSSALGPNGFTVTFTLPGNMETGTYRLRYNLDWRDLYPCGRTTVDSKNMGFNGGACYDISIYVENTGSSAGSSLLINVEGNGTVQAASDFDDTDDSLRGTIYNNGTALTSTSALFLLFTPANDYEIGTATVTGGRDGDMTFPSDDFYESLVTPGVYWCYAEANDTDIEVNAQFVAKSSAIDGIDADNDSPAVYYNLQGIRVNGESLQPGFYIARKGNKAVKVYISK